ncbi:MAG: hypothetical protein ACI4OP_02460 [Candidatus Coprovivens sp.]
MVNDYYIEPSGLKCENIKLIIKIKVVMKYNEETYKAEVAKIYNGEIKIVGKYKGLTHPILCEDKYGVMQIKTARQLIHFRPGIKAALNKTEYFMN